MKLTVKYIFLANTLWGVILDLDKYIFLWQTCYFGEGHLRLQPSCIRVNTVIIAAKDIQRKQITLFL